MQHAGEVDGDDGGVGQCGERRGRDVRTLGGDGGHLRAGLRGADGVHDHQVRQGGQQPVADRRRQRGAAVGDGEQARQVVVALLDLIDQRAGDRVADDRDAQHALALGQPEHGVGVEADDVIGQGDPAAGADGVEHPPLRGAVHERGDQQQRPDAGLGAGLFGQIAVAVQLLTAGQERPAAHGRHEDVVLAPEHTLGHAGGAAGVEDVQVLTAGCGHAAGGCGCADDLLVVHRVGQQVIAGVVGHLDEHLKIRQPAADRLHVRGELRGVDQGLGLGVPEKVEQFLLHVAVVDVERRDPGAVAGDHGFEVLVAVAHVEADVVLSGLVAGQFAAFCVTAQSAGDEVVRDPVDAGIHLPVGQPQIPPDQHLAVRDGLRDGAEDGGKVEGRVTAHGDSLPKDARTALPNGWMVQFRGDCTRARAHRFPLPHRCLVGQ